MSRLSKSHRQYAFITLLLLSISLHAVAEPEASTQPTHTEAQVNTVVDSIQQELMKHKYDRARLILVAAQEGNARACNTLGWMFDNGIGVKQDSVKALKWFESCAKSNSFAAYNAAVLYSVGRGVKADKPYAITLYKSAWLQGLQLPQIPLSIANYYYRSKEFSDAWEWASKAGDDLNDPDGKCMQARMMLEKTSPNRDDVKAVNLLNMALSSSASHSAELLAWAYGSGRVGEPNTLKAYQYALIEEKTYPLHKDALKWGDALSAEDKELANSYAEKWVKTHDSPVMLDYTHTIIVPTNTAPR